MPTVYVIAGPNGAGKTTFAREFLPFYAQCVEFLNADLIAAGLSPFDPTRSAALAARVLLERIREVAAERQDFAFETTLAGRTYAPMLRKMKQDGYRIHLYFLWLPTVEMAISRVAQRVRQGGHDIPELVIRRRYALGLRNLIELYRPMLDRWMLIDNSANAPHLILREEDGVPTLYDPELQCKVLDTVREVTRGN